ncbi:general transcription factor IIF subunit 1 [Cylas formicarius]|uniref:general transcription factor IIF subunit 1 n=1 Tax=Cylas formicarius TaxID=197179 RepID=UPI002958B7FF|nr:general transcription factor IIF subunit 1 [Cylas formicarius]
MASGSSQVTVQEFSIRVPKNVQRKYHVMRFNGNLGVDFGKWSQVKMERENNMKEFKGIEEETPKFGAGSEFGREAKEEARRKKLGIVAKKYRPDDQPWILKCFGSTVKKFKGIREGGVSENTAYYVFTHAEDGAIEAFPLHEWYNFQSIQRYKALSAEEAEMEFNKRNKHLNYFSLMLRKRLKGEEDHDLEEEGEKAKKTSKKDKELKISDMDEWMDSSDGNSSDADEEKEEEEEEKAGKKKNKKNVAKKPKKRDTDLEAVEDSDDGDEEGRELDYISDSSESEPENVNLDGVAEEKGLKKLLNSDEEESEDSEKEDQDKENDEEQKEGEESEKKDDEDKEKKKKKKKQKKEAGKKKKEADPDDDFSSDSTTDEDSKKKKSDKKQGKKDEKEPSSENSSRSVTPTIDNKRKIVNDAMAGSSKKAKLDLPNYIPGLAESGITEDAVRKYLMRKPMTTTELLQKFKSKKTGLSSEQLVNIMTQILKKINPVKQTLKGKMYLSIKHS